MAEIIAKSKLTKVLGVFAISAASLTLASAGTAEGARGTG